MLFLMFQGGFLEWFFILDKISELNWYIVGFNKHTCKEAVLEFANPTCSSKRLAV